MITRFFDWLFNTPILSPVGWILIGGFIAYGQWVGVIAIIALACLIVYLQYKQQSQELNDETQ